MTSRSARRVGLPGPAHHLFGFHDVSPWSGDFQQMLALQVDHIDHPPLDSAPARVGLVHVESGIFNAHDETTGWNFPQGARQIWCADGKTYAYNCPAGPVPRCRIRGESGELKRELPWGVAAVSPAANCLFSIDFGRVHRAGGYGHSEVLPWKNHEATRNASGLMRVDIDSGIASELVSIETCRQETGQRGSTGTADSDLDYITHVVPSPNGRRICFLYRSWLADGGIDTALCVVDAAGGGFRVLHRGNLSHFDWRDDQSIVIWGPRRQFVTALRGKGAAKRGWKSILLRQLKDIARPFFRRSGLLAATFLEVPLDGSPPRPFLPELFTGDGHPSFCPSSRRWMLCDTYPNSAGNRDLFLIDSVRHAKHMLGVFHEPRLPPDVSRLDEATRNVDQSVLRIVGRERYARARSGLHCDLHPRWRLDGGQVTFDSLHDGTRQIYTVDTVELVQRVGS